MNDVSFLEWLGIAVLASPTVLLAALSLPTLAGRPLSESATGRWTYATIVVGLLSALILVGSMLSTGVRVVPIELGDWVVIPQQHFHFHLKFIFDRLSVPFTILSFLLCGTVGAFTSRYLHR